MVRKRRAFSDEFKHQAVRRVRERTAIGATMSRIERELAVRPDLLTALGSRFHNDRVTPAFPDGPPAVGGTALLSAPRAPLDAGKTGHVIDFEGMRRSTSAKDVRGEAGYATRSIQGAMMDAKPAASRATARAISRRFRSRGHCRRGAA